MRRLTDEGAAGPDPIVGQRDGWHSPLIRTTGAFSPEREKGLASRQPRSPWASRSYGRSVDGRG